MRALFGGGTAAGFSDRQLVERYATCRGEPGSAAFEALVERHGPMVFLTCRNILRDEHDAQDAFQATFLILARKADSLWVRDSLGPWLHRVACRAAVRARIASSRRRFFERRSAEARRSDSAAVDREGGWDVLHEEIERLPERYRAVLVLCDLEGRTYEDAATQLACPVGTVKSRLARARDRLRRRLEGRVAASVVAVAREGLASGRLDDLAVPAGLASKTLLAALNLAGSAEGSVPASILVLVEQGVQAMILTKVKLASLVLCSVVLTSVGAVVLANQAAESKPAAAPAASQAETVVQKGDATAVADLQRRVRELEQRLGSPVRERIRRGGTRAPGKLESVPDEASETKTRIWDVLTMNGFIGQYDLVEVTPREMILSLSDTFQGDWPSPQQMAEVLALIGGGPDEVMAPEEIVRTLLNSTKFTSSPLAEKIFKTSSDLRRGKQ